MMTPSEHLEDIKRRFVAGELTVGQARELDRAWREVLVGHPYASRVMAELLTERSRG